MSSQNSLCGVRVCASGSPWNPSLTVRVERGTGGLAGEIQGHAALYSVQAKEVLDGSSLCLRGCMFQGSNRCAQDAEGITQLKEPLLPNRSRAQCCW